MNLELLGGIPKENILSILLGIELSNYEFSKYKTQAKEYNLNVHIDPLLIEEAMVDELNLIVESVRITKDLVNEPVSYLTAVQYAKDIQKIGKAAGFNVTIWDQKK